MTHPLSALDGKYQIIAKLREGGMGAIYKVRHRLLDEVRVIKVMRPQLEGDTSFAERFQREARAASRLRHPNIAQIHDFSIGPDGSAYIVMEYIDGIDLRELLGSERLPGIGLVTDIAAQALTALGFLHEKQFVHRDISPDNLMITSGPQGEFLVKLIDLGIAKSLESGQAVTLKGEFLGKFKYASPEHFGGQTGEMSVEPRSDLYSFGIVLYQLLTGTVPFVGKDFSTLTASHLYRPPLDFDRTDTTGRLSPELRSVVLRALEKDPADRFPSAEAMRDALVALRPAVDSGELDLGETLMMARTKRQEEEAEGVGSTQERFDRQFPDETTADTSRPTVPRPDPATRRAPEPTAVTASGPDSPTAATTLTPRSTYPAWLPWAIVGGLLFVLLAALIVWRTGEPPQRPDLLTETSEEVPVPDPADLEPSDPGAAAGEIAPEPTAEDEALAEMRAARDDLLSLETTGRPADQLAGAWSQFLASFDEDLPSTEEDDRIRELARQRQGYWDGRRAAAAELAARRNRAEAVDDSATGPETTQPTTTVQPPEPTAEAPAPPTRDTVVRTPEEARQRLAQQGITPSSAALERAIESGDRRTARLLILADPRLVPAGKPGRRLLHRALENHRFDLAEDLVKAGARPNDGFVTDAAGDGDLAVVRFLTERRLGDLEEALEDALDADEWQVARYLVSAGIPLSGAESEAEDMLIDLAEDGVVDGIRWLLSVDPGFSPQLWRKAREEALDNGFPDVARLIQEARP